MPTRAERRRAQSAAGELTSERWRSRAFGLELEGAFPAPGLPPTTGRGGGPRTRLEVVPRDTIDDGWPQSEATRVLEEWFGGATPARTIDHHEELGYRLYARHFGFARIDADGSRVQCAPPGVAAWRWQRFLVGRALPWAAVLRGLEVFHASAVGLDERAVAIIGPTGAGKTSLAVALLLRGARFLTDDVLAVDRGGDALRAHPGAAIVGIRDAERKLLGPRRLREVGKVLGHSDKTYVELARLPAPMPLGIVYFLAPHADAAAPGIEPMPAPDPRLLLTSTFVYSVQTPTRLRNQLDICAELARTVPVFVVHIGKQERASALAERLEEHARPMLQNVSSGRSNAL